MWETTGHTEQRNHAAAYRLFSEAVWNWDEVCRLLLLHVLALAPGVRLWLVLDDTLAHKRGAKVAFGGIFLDAVLSTKKHKVFRFGNNWVVLGVVVELPFRPNRYFCLSILWRVYQKQGNKPKREHRTKNQLAAEMLAVLAGWLPTREILVVADSAYIGKHLLRQRPANVEALGPIHWKAALYDVLPEAQGRTKHGCRWPTPREMLANDQQWPATKQAIPFKSGVTRELEIKTIRGVCWYDTAGPKAVQVVLVRDPAGQWRDEALICTDVRLSATEIITGYCRRWSVEVAFADAKQLLGFHDPQVWSTLAVGRAAPMAGLSPRWWSVGMWSRVNTVRRLSGTGRGTRTRRHRRSLTCWRPAGSSCGKRGSRPRVVQEQIRRTNWPGCWSMWRPATERQRFSPENPTIIACQ